MQNPDRRLPDWIDGFMLLTENSEPPRMFRKWTAISIIASALQRKVRVEWGTSLTFYPNFYIVLVGPSATGKSTAMTFGLDIMNKLPSIRFCADATSIQALIRRLKETNLTDIDHITGKQQFHSSMTVFSEEFTVFLGYHDLDKISILCNWYDCRNRWVYETIQRDKEEIIGVWVNMLAGTTPDALRDFLPLESIGIGLAGRIIFILEEKRGKLVTLPLRTEKETQLQEDLIYDLEEISLMSGCFKYTEGFLKLWDSWCHMAEENPPFRDPKFDGYNGRRRAHLMKLSMVVSASDGNREKDLVLTQDDLERSIELLTEAEVKMGLVFRGMGRTELSDMIHKAVTFFKVSDIKEIPLWQFARSFEGDLDKFEMERVIHTLEAMKMISRVKKPGADEMIIILEGGENETK